MNLRMKLGAAVAVMALAAMAGAQDSPVTLKAGDPAPPLVGGKWLKGEPVDKFEPGKIYVVECWATWCGPCKAAIPHVTEMQKEFAKDGVTFIGQNVWERDQSLSAPFVAQMGDKMDYRVRMDDVPGEDPNEGAMVRTWLQPAGQTSIPCSFLVGKDGKIAWIGHPMEIEPILKQVIAGTFDAKKTAAVAAAKEQQFKELNAAVQAKDFDGAMAKVDDIEKSNPEFAAQAVTVRFQILMMKKDYPAADIVAQKALDDGKNSEQMAMMAFNLSQTKQPANLQMAEKLATKAVEVTGGKEFKPLFVQTRVFYAEGLTDKAVESQTKTLEVAPAELKPQLSAEFAKMAKAPATQPAK